ncbi:MAG: hypothetical protein OSB73_20245 [Candidatus Latescibacteria bacterium]|nr:hypothetical protein [Candidatus Latescibacterota bacterium]
MIEVESLRKPYGEFVAVDEISLQIKPGEIFGLPPSQWRGQIDDGQGADLWP